MIVLFFFIYLLLGAEKSGKFFSSIQNETDLNSHNGYYYKHLLSCYDFMYVSIFHYFVLLIFPDPSQKYIFLCIFHWFIIF